MPTSVITAVKSGGCRIDVLARFLDGTLEWKFTDETSWSPSRTGWMSLGRDVLQVAGASSATFPVEAFVTGASDERIYYRAFTGTTWIP
jgi:hypothetical protein